MNATSSSRTNKYQKLLDNRKQPIRGPWCRNGNYLARLTVEDVPILIAARLLKPLGNPAANGPKFFAASELLELSKDKVWQIKVTNAVNHHWQRNNCAKKKLQELVLDA